MAHAKEIVNISSSEEEDDYDEADEDDEEEEEGDNEETGDEGWSLSGDDSEWSGDNGTESDHDDVNDDDDDDEENGDGDDDEDSLVNKVIRLLKDGCNLKALTLKECKAYLRKHGLRLSGTKDVCIERIIEHWRIKDGDGEAIYPRSCFVINCRGDVCKGDTVLFTQKVYQKFDRMKRSGKLSGTRTVAGKVVKESYGAAKQQHTFTIEVLWSKGINKLPPLYPLLVKGRNLYRLKTFRQPWANEEDRQKVLSEKHKRGTEARNVRDMRRVRKLQFANARRDDRRQKHGHDWKPCQKVKTRKAEMVKHAKKHENPYRGQKPYRGNKNPTERRNLNKPCHSYTPQAYTLPHSYAPSSIPRSNVPHSYAPWPHAPYSYAYPTQNLYASQNQLNQSLPPFYDRGSTSNAMRQASFEPQANASYRRSYRNYYAHHPNPNPGYNYGVGDLDRLSEMMISQRLEGNAYRWRNHRRRSNH